VPAAEIQIDALRRIAVTGIAPPKLGGDADEVRDTLPAVTSGEVRARVHTGQP
jgi:hypothetical protein